MQAFNFKEFLRKKIAILLIFILNVFIGCSDEFSVEGQVTKNFATYCILDNRLNIQYVIINKVYLNDSLKKMPDSTKVILSESSGQNYNFSEITIPGFSQYSVYSYPIVNFKRGYPYRLIINHPGFPLQWAETTIPKKLSSLTSETIKIELHQEVSFIINLIFPKDNCRMHKINVFFDLKNSRTQKTGTVQVVDGPLFLDNKPIGDAYNIYNSYNSTMLSISLSGEGLRLEFAKFLDKESPYDLVLKRAYMVFYGMDISFYDYLFDNGQKASSTRMDNPIYPTNFNLNDKKGLGFFSSIAVDTFKFKLNNREFFEYYGYEDGMDY